MPEAAALLSEPANRCLVASAGCGKTETIVSAVILAEGRQLILTHTHAGIDSLKRRLKSRRVPPGKYRVETIAGWLLRYVRSFPAFSGFTGRDPESDDEWDKLYGCAYELFLSNAAADVVRLTYSGVFVDEYQDCTIEQHRIVQLLGSIIPCRVLGDPLQAIFDFRSQLVDWDEGVYPNFERIGDLVIPERWHRVGTRDSRELGDWLLDVRARLEAGHEIDLRRAPRAVEWAVGDFRTILAWCRRMAEAGGSAAIIHLNAAQCHVLASRLGGRFQSMDEMEARDLMKHAAKLDRTAGGDRALALIEFASSCITGVTTRLTTVKRYCVDGFPVRRRATIAYPETEQSIARVISSSDGATMLSCIDAIRKEVSQGVLYRSELWMEMRRTLQLHAENPDLSVSECARLARGRTKVIGRRPSDRVVSRTLLVKGLEFDHVGIVDAERMDTKNLYVALTRARKTLTIWCPEPILCPSSTAASASQTRSELQVSPSPQLAMPI